MTPPFLALDTPPPHIRAVRTDAPPTIDGVVSEDAWKKAARSSAFTQKYPTSGAEPTEHTTMLVLYDDVALYVAFECEQTKAGIVPHVSRRDRLVEADRVEIDLGTRADHKSAFRFTVNTGGVLTDAVLFNDTDSASDWDENWEAHVSTSSHGWSVEILIPLRVLRFSTADVQAWDFQARRYISEKQEIDEWSYIPREEAGEVSRYGRLDDLRGLRAGFPVEVKPFVLGRFRRRDAASTELSSGTDFAGSAGLDLKWHPTQSLTLDVAVNPDFAQVEADQRVLNLSTFETYYPEKRPFFLEGIDLFTTPRQLVYTRRIGHAADPPNLRAGPPYGEQLVNVPEAAPVYGAVKLQGEIAPKWIAGTLQALTGENDVNVQLADGSRQKRLADPMTSYNAVRVKREFEGNAYVGALFTQVARAEQTSDTPYLPPGPTDAPNATRLCPSTSATSTPVLTVPVRVPRGARCFNDAYAGSLDWRWRSSEGAWVTGGQAIATSLREGPNRLVRDGTVIRPGDVGSGAFAYLNKEGGEHWVGDLQLEYEGRKLDYNDLGYNQRSNDYRWRTDLEYREMKPWWRLLETHARFEYFGRTNTDGLWIGGGYQLNLSGTLDNFWQFFTEVHYRPAYFDDREVGDGTALERGGVWGYELELASNPAKPVSFNLQTQSQVVASGGFMFNGGGGLLLRALPALDLEVLPTGIYSVGEPRFASGGAVPGQYLFGKLTAKALGTTLRATYAFTPQLTLQAYSQLFLASGHYTDLSEFDSAAGSGARTVRLSALHPYVLAPPQNPDFEQGALNVNVVLRWEYTVGSTLFFVYTRAQSPAVALGAGDAANLRLDPISRAPAADVVLVKLSYFFAR